MAYQIFFSLIPLLALVIGLLGFVYGPDRAQRELGELVREVYPAGTGDETRIIRQLVEGRALSLGIGLVGTLLSVTAILGSIDIAIAHVLGREGKRPLLQDRLNGLAFVVSVVVLAIASFAVSYGVVAAAELLRGTTLAGIRVLLELLSPVAGIATGYVFFFLVFRFAPRRRVGRRAASDAAVVSAVLWELAKILFGVLTRILPVFEAYGALAFAAGLLTWIYLTAVIILIGAEVLKTRNA